MNPKFVGLAIGLVVVLVMAYLVVSLARPCNGSYTFSLKEGKFDCKQTPEKPPNLPSDPPPVQPPVVKKARDPVGTPAQPSDNADSYVPIPTSDHGHLVNNFSLLDGATFTIDASKAERTLDIDVEVVAIRTGSDSENISVRILDDQGNVVCSSKLSPRTTIGRSSTNFWGRFGRTGYVIPSNTKITLRADIKADRTEAEVVSIRKAYVRLRK